MRNARNFPWPATDGVAVRDRNRPGADIAERLLEWAAALVRPVDALPKRAVTSHIGLQMVPSATSAGANDEEARRAEIGADFVPKVGLAATELGEALYWLRLLDKLALLRVEPAVQREADELIAILVASARTARARRRRSRSAFPFPFRIPDSSFSAVFFSEK